MRSYCILVVFSFLAACSKPGDATTSTAAPAQQAIGGADGGGGDLPQSTEVEVRKAVNDVMSNSLRHALTNLAIGQSQIQDAYVSSVFETFFDSRQPSAIQMAQQPVFVDLSQTSYYFEENSGCIDNTGHAHAAGVASRSRGSKICFSVPLLRLIPTEDLPSQILALAAHEITHHFGFGEFEATKVQNFIAHHATDISWPHEGTFVKFLSPLTFVAPSTSKTSYRFNVSYVMNEGRLSALNEFSMPELTQLKTPYCVFEVRYESGHPVNATINASGMNLGIYNSIADWDSQTKLMRVSNVTFTINPFFNGSYKEQAGLVLTSANGQPNDAKLVGISCHSNDFHTMDISLIAGSLGLQPQLL